MRIFERLEQQRGWTAEERLVLDQVRRLAAEQIAPAASGHDKDASFPWDNVRALNELAEMLEGVHDLTLKEWVPVPLDDDAATVYFKTAWPDDSRAVDKPAGGNLSLRRVGDAWYLQGFGFQGRGIRPGTKTEANTGLSY